VYIFIILAFPRLKVIVSRTNFIASHTNRVLRIIGLSTALANAQDLSHWLGVSGQVGLYNFRPSVRPVPLEVHIQGFSGNRAHRDYNLFSCSP
jgi:activating signal cointegrator complex subunit 3